MTWCQFIRTALWRTSTASILILWETWVSKQLDNSPFFMLLFRLCVSISVYFQMSCVPASYVPTERPASTEWRSCRLSDGSCSAEKRSNPTRTKYINDDDNDDYLFCGCQTRLLLTLYDLKTKGAVSGVSDLKQLLIHQTENWKLLNRFPCFPLFLLCSHRIRDNV